MIRVLFVDDEPRVLRGLQRMLGNLHCEWDMEFALSGREALEHLAARTFDVVVTDMRMPEMDGVALLNEVRRRHPAVVRIVLSGQSDPGLILRSVDAAHRYLAKPCEPEVLRNTVAQAVGVRRVLADSSLRSLVSRLSKLPSAPRLYRDLMVQIQTSDESLRELGKIVSQDIGMTVKILHIVNSAFFGMPRHVSDPVQAVCLLGLEVLKALVITVHIFSELATDRIGELHIDSLWVHSTETGAIARHIATAEGCARPVCDHALMAGLLHDTGKLILAANQPGRYREAVRLATHSGMTPLEAERRVFGTTHAEVGAYLLGLWGVPDPILEAVAFHHRPAECATTTVTPLTAVHVADALEHARRDASEERPPERLDLEYLKRLGVAERWPAWHHEYVSQASACTR